MHFHFSLPLFYLGKKKKQTKTSKQTNKTPSNEIFLVLHNSVEFLPQMI